MKASALLLLLAAWLLAAPVASAQPAPPSPPTTTAPDPADGRKARLLAAMARWVNQYGGEAAADVTTALDSGSVAGFRQSVAKYKVLTDLTSRAEAKVANKAFAAAPVKQVADAIRLTVSDRYSPRPGATHLPSLAAALTRIAAEKEGAATVTTPAPAATAAAPVAATETTPAPSTVTPAAPAASPWGNIGGYAAAFVAGFVLAWFWMNQRVIRREAALNDVKSQLERARLRTTELKGKLATQERERAENSERSRPPAPLPIEEELTETPPPASLRDVVATPEVTTEPDWQPEPERFVEFDALAPAAVGPAWYYGPAPDVPWLEHRKLSAEPLDVMPVRMLVPGGPDGQQASYEFSPQANQGRILADGVRNLRAFFDFDLPPSEHFTRVQTTEPGRLERVGDRWEVREKARLVIS